MACLRFSTIEEAENECVALLEEQESIRISVGFLIEWRSVNNESVKTQHTLSAVTLDRSEIESGLWTDSWDGIREGLEVLKEFNAVQSSLSFEAVLETRLNWLAYIGRDNSERGVGNVERNREGDGVDNNGEVESGERRSANGQVGVDRSSFSYLLFICYRIRGRSPAPTPSRPQRRAYEQFMARFGLEHLRNSVANISNIGELCTGLRGVAVVVYNRRGNVVFRYREDDEAELQFSALLYWNELRMSYIRNFDVFMNRRRRLNGREYCISCNRMHNEENGCDVAEVKLGEFKTPERKHDEAVLLTMYCDFEALCPPGARRQSACCYSLVCSTGTSLKISEQLIESVEEQEDDTEAENTLVQRLLEEIEICIGRYYGWQSNNPIIKFDHCMHCTVWKRTCQFRRVVGALEDQFQPARYEMVCDECMARERIARLYTAVVFFHNFSKYDVCFIIRELAHNYKLRLAGRSKELLQNVHCVKKYIRFYIRDSLHFIQGSIANFAKGIPDNRWEQYPQIARYRELFDGGKGAFAYDWLENRQQLFEPFPDDPRDRENLLSGEVVNLAQLRQFCEQHDIATVGEYLQKYCTVDVLILMFYFDMFRCTIYGEFRVDIAQFYSISAVSWYLATHDKEDLQVPTSIEDYICIRDNIRGGVAQPMIRYAEIGIDNVQAIKMLDVNALYSWSMTHKLPMKHLGTRTYTQGESTADCYQYMLDRPENETWLCLVDLEYPEELFSQNAHFNFPLAPSRFKNRLCTTFFPHKKYLVLDVLLQFYVEHGLRITRWHSIQRWENAPIFKDFIEQNIAARNTSTDKIIKDVRKIANNSLYGKTCENVFRYKTFVIDKFQTQADENGTINRAAENWQSFTILDEEYVVAEVKRLQVLLNKPVQLGFAILELAKLRVYSFWHALNYEFGNDVSLLYTDTDSLLLAFRVQHAFAIMRRSAVLSAYVDLPLDEANNELPPTKKLGLFSDELHGKSVLKYIGLKAKSYVIVFADEDTKVRVKGIRKAAKSTRTHRQLCFTDFETALFSSTVEEVKEYTLHKKNYHVYLRGSNKRALSNLDTKHFYPLDLIHAFPWGFPFEEENYQ